MHTLKVTLKQHTPLIHFQHDQEGATLRASEVKPKLDKFLLDNAIGESFEDSKTFLVGYSLKNERLLCRKFTDEKFRALDYKLAFIPQCAKHISLNPHYDPNRGKYIANDFPLLLSNMGGKDTLEELADFSMYEKIELTIHSKNEDLLETIRGWIDLFFATNNFGQRQDKGFGSFSVIKINGDDIEFPKKDLPTKTRFLKFEFPNNLQEFDVQSKLFQVIDFYWKCLVYRSNCRMQHHSTPCKYRRFRRLKAFSSKIDA